MEKKYLENPIAEHNGYYLYKEIGTVNHDGIDYTGYIVKDSNDLIVRSFIIPTGGDEDLRATKKLSESLPENDPDIEPATYEAEKEMNKMLDKIGSWSKKTESEESNNVAEIYQTDAAFRFDPYELALRANFTIDDYKKVAEVDLSKYDTSKVPELLEDLFAFGNSQEFHDLNQGVRSVSVSDIIKVNDNYYYVDSFGFKRLPTTFGFRKEEMDDVKLPSEENPEETQDMIQKELDKKYLEEAEVSEEEKDQEIFDKLKNEPEDEDIIDLLQDRIGQTLSVGEFNTILQSLFGNYNEIYLLASQLYNVDDIADPQEVVIFEDEDMYTITYNIISLEDKTIEITDVVVE